MQRARTAGRSRRIRRQYTLAALLNEQTTRADTDEPDVRRTRLPPAIPVALTVMAGLFLSIAGEGPDFGHYTDWAAAALSGRHLHAPRQRAVAGRCPVHTGGRRAGPVVRRREGTARAADARGRVAADRVGRGGRLLVFGARRAPPRGRRRPMARALRCGRAVPRHSRRVLLTRVRHRGLRRRVDCRAVGAVTDSRAMACARRGGCRCLAGMLAAGPRTRRALRVAGVVAGRIWRDCRRRAEERGQTRARSSRRRWLCQ